MLTTFSCESYYIIMSFLDGTAWLTLFSLRFMFIKCSEKFGPSCENTPDKTKFCLKSMSNLNSFHICYHAVVNIVLENVV